MKFSLAVAMIPLSQLVALAKVAEECGFSSITMPDSLFFPERGATGYPYTADGVRMWDAKTPFVDPMIAAAFMGPGTSKIRFYPQVLELSSRNPLLLASQVGSVANLTGGRFGLGVGVGWAPEEFEWCGASPKDRGPRVDEMLEVLRLVLGGGMVEHHGKFFDFDRLQMSRRRSIPSPSTSEDIPRPHCAVQREWVTVGPRLQSLSLICKLSSRGSASCGSSTGAPSPRSKFRPSAPIASVSTAPWNWPIAE